MKIVKLVVAMLTMLSILLLSGCGGTNSTSNKNYEGTWFSIDQKGTISKMVIEKQEKAYLISHTDYTFDYPPNYDRGNFNFGNVKVSVHFIKEERFPKQLLEIKEGTIKLQEDMGIGTLVFKENKFIGKPSPRYKKELTFEKKTDKDLPAIYKTAKETFTKYMSTREKYPIDANRLKFFPSEAENEFKTTK